VEGALPLLQLRLQLQLHLQRLLHLPLELPLPLFPEQEVSPLNFTGPTAPVNPDRSAQVLGTTFVGALQFRQLVSIQTKWVNELALTSQCSFVNVTLVVPTR